MMGEELRRCAWLGTWAGAADPVYRRYHDEEWGVPCRDERQLFEMLLLDGAQAGLAWITVLKKRENYRQAFASFDADIIAAYTEDDVQRLLANPGIIRNQAKIRAFIGNARAWNALRAREDAVAWLWQFVDGRPVHNHWRTMADIPTSTPASDSMARELKKLGFRFVGTTICYAFMQAAGMVNDHTTDCYRHAALLPAASGA